MSSDSLTINGKPTTVNVDGATPLVWVLRELLQMTGTKFGCGIAQCGACTVHVDGRATRSCVTPLSAVAGKTVTTIEGLPKADGTLHAVQRAWIEQQVPQCGYCQPGFIMATAALLAANPRPTDREVDEALSNLCRCGTYGAIRRAIRRAVQLLQAAP